MNHRIVLLFVTTVLAWPALAEKTSGQASAKAIVRTPFYGDMHVHTSLSFDAFLFGNTAALSQNSIQPSSTLYDAYQFAQGNPIHIAGDADGSFRTVTINQPLDFVAITDHSEYLGETEICTDQDDLDVNDVDILSGPGVLYRPLNFDDNACVNFRNSSGNSNLFGLYGLYLWGTELEKDPNDGALPQRDTAICETDLSNCEVNLGSVWQNQVIALANSNNALANFTAFVAYEWTAMPSSEMMHRNVIFRNDTVPDAPVSYFDAQTPEGLWSLLESACGGLAGCDYLAIPHNPNLSAGRMFPLVTEAALTVQDARRRARNEPLVEMIQTKGESECKSGLLTADEFCNFEKLDQRPMCTAGQTPATDNCLDDCNQTGADPDNCVYPNAHVRNALKEGLEIAAQVGDNPYVTGFIGSTDTHNSMPGGVDESDYQGHHARAEATATKRLNLEDSTTKESFLVYNPGGLAGVWAESNSRDSIFDALKRRETFATSGTRMAVHLFQVHDLPAGFCSQSGNDLSMLYDYGQPMGSVTEGGSRAQSGGGPVFVAWAVRSALTQSQPLERMQMVKLWRDPVTGEEQEQVEDILCADGATPQGSPARCPDNGAVLDLSTCTSDANSLSSSAAWPWAGEMCVVWQDVSFQADQPAIYYLRVLENPSCRWSQQQCLAQFGTYSDMGTADAGDDVFANMVDPADGTTPVSCADLFQDGSGVNHACDTQWINDTYGNNAADYMDEAGCCCGEVPRSIRERAWSSPIWLNAPLFMDGMEG